MTVYALYVARENDHDHAICVGLWGELKAVLIEAELQLVDGHDVSIESGDMTVAEWDAIEEVPDDFAFPGISG